MVCMNSFEYDQEYDSIKVDPQDNLVDCGAAICFYANTIANNLDKAHQDFTITYTGNQRHYGNMREKIYQCLYASTSVEEPPMRQSSPSI